MFPDIFVCDDGPSVLAIKNGLRVGSDRFNFLFGLKKFFKIHRAAGPLISIPACVVKPRHIYEYACDYATCGNWNSFVR